VFDLNGNISSRTSRDVGLGYMAAGTAFEEEQCTYDLVDGWNGFAWSCL
jgi:hypothetical protein